jgi:hypothetical protein
MGIVEWISQNWFESLTVTCGICGLWFSAFAIHQNTKAQKEETKARKTSNLLAITANHREIWKEIFYRPDLSRVLDDSADVANSRSHRQRGFSSTWSFQIRTPCMKRSKMNW